MENRINDPAALKPEVLYWLISGIVLAGLPHWGRLPFWIPVIHTALLFFRIYIPAKHPRFWSAHKNLIGFVRLGILIIGVTGIYISYGSLAGRDVGIALLVMLAGLKVFEIKNHKDFYVSAYLGYFLVITNFFYTQTIPTAIYMFFIILIMTSGLIVYNDTEQKLNFFERTRFASALLIQSAPILLILFILFPRISGPLWGLPTDAHAGITGINDQMTPGTISKLVQSDEVAFRVTFKGAIPDQSKLYWRGPVLWKTDGRKWTTGSADTDKRPAPVRFKGELMEYDLTIEPTNTRWLFGLEMVTEAPQTMYLTHDRILKSEKPIRSRKAYKLISYADYFYDKKTGDRFERALALPEKNHLKTKRLGTRLREENTTQAEIVDAALAWLKDKDFVYTLNPPLITGDVVDDFLFEVRQGFCEHYAAAFVVLMRSAGIPARVVTGYLGGEVNPLGNYLIVKQYHAHAWTEVWLPDQGWVRIDPTSIVSPDRISDGIEMALPAAIIDIPLTFKNNATAIRLWQRLKNTIDVVNYQWAKWVLGYSPDRQKYFMALLGLYNFDWKKLTIAMVMLLVIVLALTGYLVVKGNRSPSDPTKRYYEIFCKKLAGLDIIKKPYEGPVDFSRRISRLRADLYHDSERITELYVAIRYKSENDKYSLFKKAVKSFSPPRLNVKSI